MITTFEEFKKMYEGETTYFNKDTKWIPTRKFEGVEYFTISPAKEDDEDEPPVFSKKETELVKDGYGIEMETAIRKYDYEATRAELEKKFKDVTFIESKYSYRWWVRK